MTSPRIWFITGASSGLGRSMTELVLSRGEIAIATARRVDRLADLASQYSPDRLLVLHLDVTKEDEIAAAFSKSREVFGRIDVVYNNAGYGYIGETEAVPQDYARTLFETNFWGVANISRASVAFFRDVNEPQGGRLLQMSSMYGLSGGGGAAYYSASKFAIEGFTESLARELDPAWNIKFTILEPGFFRTPSVDGITIFEHSAYTNPALESVALRKMFENLDVSLIKGDPDKLSKAVYKLTGLEDPPLRLMLGRDMLETAKGKIAKMKEEMESYASWSDNITFD